MNDEEREQAEIQAWIDKLLSDDEHTRWQARSVLPERWDQRLLKLISKAGPQAEQAWTLLIEVATREEEFYIFDRRQYGLSNEVMLRIARLGRPWHNGPAFSQLLIPRRESSVSDYVHPALEWSPQDPETGIRDLVARLGAYGHAQVIQELFLSTFTMTSAWPWPGLVEDIRRKCISAKVSLLRSILRGFRYRESECETLTKALDYLSQTLDVEEFCERMRREWSGKRIDRSLRKEIDAPYARLWQEDAERRRIKRNVECLKSGSYSSRPLIVKLLDPEYNHAHIDLNEANRLIRIVKEFIVLPADRHPFKPDELDDLLAVLNRIVEAHRGDRAEQKRLDAEQRRLEAKQAAEQRRLDAERAAELQRLEAIRAKEQERLEAHKRLHRQWQERIAARCRGIVHVFNGVFGLEINPDSVLSGEVSGSYATIQSGGGMHLEMRQMLELRQELSQQIMAGTWLELEEGAVEAEWAKAYEAANCLIWHELGHLADAPTLLALLRSVPEYVKLPEEHRHQAKELAIDAIALNLAEALYVHVDKGRHQRSGTKRQHVMVRSFYVQIGRILDWSKNAEFDTELICLLVRFQAELEAFRTFRALPFVPEEIVHGLVRDAISTRAGMDHGTWSGLFTAYSAIYDKVRRLDVLKLDFHQEVQSLEDEESGDPSDTGKPQSFAVGLN